MRPTILFGSLMTGSTYSAKPEFKEDAAKKVKPIYDGNGQLSHILWEPSKMVVDNSDLDKNELKIQIKSDHNEHFCTVITRPIVVHGRYQHDLSTIRPYQYVRGSAGISE